ncbi:fibrobacter succinogenes major paralogous domain-containing protein [Flavihumibacter petaseus]|uniref:Fibrobacter succinogenes major paralogous domain-containing protein n=1 Tax=Flavihumibacter petaseus NBRC 106054 TaxID=1220578 RepID=A0A0E9N4Z2_9BACT|nr:fibrobacter succinogenes major paralogous domain-containing protein [Flavihumibacter petaseus]GAO44879.1 hypothetical protein FPE01S_04_01220 [Flavihumibacter petaseus NBRC 106054]
MNLRSTLPLLGLPAILLFSCTKTDQLLNLEELALKKSGDKKQVKCVDVDGNSYRTVKIGDKVWMAENLRVTRYRNGQAIPNVSNATEWKNTITATTKGAWCYYDNNTSNNLPYGKLYNWYAVSDTRGLAPKGWHIPTEQEWIELGRALGGCETAASKMKTTGNLTAGDGLWQAPNDDATNSSGFSAFPAGDRNSEGVFAGKSQRTRFWTSVQWEGDPSMIYCLSTNMFAGNPLLVNNDYDIIGYFSSYAAVGGLSVRCVKD